MAAGHHKIHSALSGLQGNRPPTRISAGQGPVGDATAASRRCAPEGTRTPNLLIRSQMLYPLSYGRPTANGRGRRPGDVDRGQAYRSRPHDLKSAGPAHEGAELAADPARKRQVRARDPQAPQK